ncbi:30S ribosomal protein S20 [Acetilactobacillus jinshanensis]|uniref:Small ribosomal subunit protein bS20 n=1 Tax=Acetilactobacillus jinshanensis TaxID=1720083 RepID=A0A4P6ZJV5_9LACO|nr:30S ribosomal protein S20 [Acetilactobacillus jinshanensis]QBP17928.1 30S ribosomal protein S20 [Acetilactobacillus jinshanensis]URL60791.1 30S ribosomal protein S20 [uncultured bacterium]
MPVIKSAIKRVRTNANAKQRNVAQRSKAKSAIKKFLTAKKAGSKDLGASYKSAISAIDRAKSKGLIKANKAKRQKSHLAKQFNK